MLSESFTKAILFLIKNSISPLDQPPSGPITFHKTPPFLSKTLCFFFNQWFKLSELTSLVTDT